VGGLTRSDRPPCGFSAPWGGVLGWENPKDTPQKGSPFVNVLWLGQGDVPKKKGRTKLGGDAQNRIPWGVFFLFWFVFSNQKENENFTNRVSEKNREGLGSGC